MANGADGKSLRVTIAGTEYKLRGDASVEHLRAVASKVDELLSEIVEGHPQLDEKRAAILTAVNLADQLYRLQIQYESLLQLLDEKTTSSANSQ